MGKNKRYNLSKVNVDIFSSDDNLDNYIEIADNEAEISAKCEAYKNISFEIKLKKISNKTGDYWLAEHPELPGCITHGATKEEALRNLEDAKEGWIYSKISDGETIPMPSDHQSSNYMEVSGKILLRLPKELHYKVAQMAKVNSVSINQELNYLIAQALGENNALKAMTNQLMEIKEIVLQNAHYKKAFDAGAIYQKLITELDFKSFAEKSVNKDYHPNDYEIYQQSKRVTKPLSTLNFN